MFVFYTRSNSQRAMLSNITMQLFKHYLPMPNSTPTLSYPSERTLSFIREFAHSFRIIKTKEQNVVYSVN